MAIATPQTIFKDINKGLGETPLVEKPVKGIGLYFQQNPCGITLRKKAEPTDGSRKGLKYRKDLWCYADQLYQDRDYYWIGLWAKYYGSAKQKKKKVVQGERKKKKNYAFDPKKDIGRHSLWMKTILTDNLTAFNDAFIEAEWTITDVKVENKTLTFKVQYGNRTEEETPLKYFDDTLIRMLGRV